MENVMLSSTNDRIKIVDFGLSNVYTGDRLLHTHCGSPEYAAPELFVEGKPYGPEVDLWSLGVILYGMAVGQLPFVSGSRDGAAATQRRDKLIEQINKGLSAPHRKALTLFSADFKAMMGKLLVADSSKRINIGELIFHPWITEKGRKAIRSNPLKKLDDRSRFDIIKNVATTSEFNWQDVQRALHIEPQGNLAGMYNLLAHKTMNNTLDAEYLMAKMHTSSSSRPAASRNMAECAKCVKLKTQVVKRQDTVRSTPAQKPCPPSKKPESAKPLMFTTKSGDTTRCFGDTTTRKTLAAKRPNMANDNRAREPVQENTDGKICQTSMSSPRTCEKINKQEVFVGAKGLHALHNRTNHTRSPAGDAARDNTQCIFNAFVCDSGPAQNTRSKKTKIDAMAQQSYANPRLINTFKNTHRTLSATVKPPENRLSLQNKTAPRPLTTGVTSALNARPMKRRSLLPVLQMNKTTTSATNGLRKNALLPKSRLHQITKSAPLERSDDFKRYSNGGINRKVDLSNEPIARSIAGYMTKNISKTKVESLKWIKGATSNYGT